MRALLRAGGGYIGLVVLALLCWLSVATLMPPAPVSSDAAATTFSAERAAVHVESLSAKPHPAGSQAARDARDYLVTALTELGLEPVVEQSVGMIEGESQPGSFAATGTVGGVALANVENIVAPIPGADSTGTVYLVAHYDSTQLSYGANDNAANVAAVIEATRAILAGSQQNNDIVLLLTDAEEACLCGAEAFVNDHPEAGGVVLNFEARGSAGPAIMFETSVANAGVVATYAASVPHAVATSFAVEVYRILPNDTDFSVFRDSGRFVGLNSAYIDGSATYHTAADAFENVSLGSLQQQGSNALALTLAFSAADLTEHGVPSDADVTYFPVLGSLVTYSELVMWGIAVLALGVVLVAVGMRVPRGEVTLRAVALSVATALIPVLASALVVLAWWRLVVLLRPDYAELADPWHALFYRVAAVFIAAAVTIGWFLIARRRVGTDAVQLGALLLISLVGIMLAVLMPGASYLFSVPALAGGVGAIIAITADFREGALVGALLSSGAAVVILAPAIVLFFPALGMRGAAAPAMFAAVGVLVMLPFIECLVPMRRRRLSRKRRAARRLVGVGITGGVVVALTVAGMSIDRLDDRHPVPVELSYAMDSTTGEAFWVRCSADFSGWSDAMVDTPRDLSAQFPVLPTQATVGSAVPVGLAPARIEVVSDSTTNDGRQVELRITPREGARFVAVQTDGADVLGATVEGREVPLQADGSVEFAFHAPGTDGIRLTLELAVTDPFDVRVVDGTDGIESLPQFLPRPAGIGSGRSQLANVALVAITARV